MNANSNVEWMMNPIAKSLVLAGLFVVAWANSGRAIECASDEGVSVVDVQEDWKRPDFEGQREYRAWVRIPESWRERDVRIFLEGADDARQLRINDREIVTFGAFPPSYRSGLGEAQRVLIDPDVLRPGAWNQVSLLVFRRASRDNFNVAAPALFAGEDAIRLAGNWLRHDTNFATGWAPTEAQRNQCQFDSVEPAEVVAGLLQRLENELGPQTPQDSLAMLTPAEGLEIELVLSDPDIGQPLSIKFDERGRLWVVEYLQYPDPAGLTVVSRDKFLRTVYDKLPLPPPHHDVGADRISIHEDRDGDGTFETHSVFVDGLNMVSSFAIGRGGVYVLNPPYLLFYADANRDDQPDGDPLVLLEGFGLEDSHSLTNSLRWGPDGWLYAAQGSTVTGNVRAPGSEAPPLQTMGQLVWRYHPESMEYEVFAEGGGNAFGLEIDAAGRIFSGHNGGDTRGFHYVQGGYFQKSFGKHGELSNPFTFGYFPWMKHHSAQRFSHTFVIEQGGRFPAPFAGRLFGVEPLQSRVVMSEIKQDGSTFRTEDVGYAWTSEDVWVRPVDIQSGPDGALYVVDFYEQRIDHSSHYQGRVHRESGRVYRIIPATAEEQAFESFDLQASDDDQLAEYLRHPNRWWRQAALRVIGDRKQTSASVWIERLASNQGPASVNDLWAAYQTEPLSDEQFLVALNHPSEVVRAWAVRLAADDRRVSPLLLDKLIEMATTEASIEVRSQLASSARRLEGSGSEGASVAADGTIPIVRALSTHAEDINDPHLPLLLWWAIESETAIHPDAIFDLVADASWRTSPMAQEFLLSRIMRRFASTGRMIDLQRCGDLLTLAEEEASASALLIGFDQAFAGRVLSELPSNLAQSLLRHRGDSLELRIQLGDRSRLEELHARLLEATASEQDKLNWLALLGTLSDPTSVSTLWTLIEGSEPIAVRVAALNALRSYDQEAIAEKCLSIHSQGEPEIQRAIESLLVSRTSWVLPMLSGIEAGQIDKEGIDRQTIDRISVHLDPRVQEKFTAIWGAEASAEGGDLERAIDSYVSLLEQASGNPYRGRELFADHCGRCHRLFADGGDIGPELTSFYRSDVRRMLASILNPSQEIREGYETQMIVTIDGQIISGFIADQDPRQIVIRQSDGQTIVVEQDEIDVSQAIQKSVMPAGILPELDEQQVRDLFAYLRSTQPLPN